MKIGDTVEIRKRNFEIADGKEKQTGSDSWLPARVKQIRPDGCIVALVSNPGHAWHDREFTVDAENFRQPQVVEKKK